MSTEITVENFALFNGEEYEQYGSCDWNLRISRDPKDMAHYNYDTKEILLSALPKKMKNIIQVRKRMTAGILKTV